MSETKTVEQELLEALKDLVSVVMELHPDADKLGGLEQAWAAIRRAEKAAEKSTGELVVEALRKSGVDASWEYPGYVSIGLGDRSTWAFGTSNRTWTGDLTDDGGYSVKGIELEDKDGPIASASTDVEAIREAILDALNEHNNEAGTSTNQC